MEEENKSIPEKEDVFIDEKEQEKFEEKLIQVDEIKKEKNRKKIDKLLAKDIRYRGPFSYRAIRVLGFLFLIFAQLVLCYSFVSNIIDMPAWSEKFFEVIDVISVFSLPMFLTVNFCIIMTSRNKIKKYLILYSCIAILIYLSILFVYYRYVNGIIVTITGDPTEGAKLAEVFAKSLFGSVINYNIFVDLSLFSFFFFFFFYTPGKIKSKKALIWFRLCSIIPILIAVVSFLLYGAYCWGKIDLPVAALSIMPCRSIGIYAVFVVISLFIKLRKYLFIRWGGTPEEYEKYIKTNKSSLEISVISVISIIGVSLIDFIAFIINPLLLLNGIGTTFYIAFIAPVLLLLSYTRKPKHEMIDTFMPFMAFGVMIICYLEAILFVIKHI